MDLFLYIALSMLLVDVFIGTIAMILLIIVLVRDYIL